MPKLEVKHALRDFGSVTEGEPVQHSFRIENAGSAALVLESIERSFGCEATLPLAREVAPGQSLDIFVSCDTNGRVGKLEVALPLRSNDTTSHAELAIRAKVIPLLAFEPFLVELVTPHGGIDTREAQLIGARAAQAKLAVKDVEAGGPKVELLDRTATRPAALKLTLNGDRVRSGSGRVLVSTGIEKPSELMLSYLFRVTGNVEIDPSRPYVNLRQPGPKSVLVNVTSQRKDFELRSVEVLEGPFTAEFTRAENGPGYRVRITVDEARMDDQTRGVNGKLVLVSNDPAEPAKEISVLAFGVLNRVE